MDVLNSVEINKIKVSPLSEWKYLLSRTPPARSTWPRSSSLLCWWCCHAFAHVPAFLPVSVDINAATREGTFVFTGNFCSWNCVKRYALTLEHHKKAPEGCHYIGILAYLTVCRGQPCEGKAMHDLGLCDCLIAYRGVKAAPGREVLQAFGGSCTIEQYRENFHHITDYESVQRNFGSVDQLLSVKRAALESPHSKYWGFHYLHYTGPDTSFTTFVNILPLTNRTFDKKTLVTTGNEAVSMADAGACEGKTTGGPGDIDIDIDDNDDDDDYGGGGKISQVTAALVKRGGGTSAKTVTRGGNGPGPKPRRIPRRNKVVNQPTTSLHSSSSSSNPTAMAMATAAATAKAAGEQQPLMTAEQVLSCNDEQMFYTNSLRGYGNILTSMGIKVSRTKEEEKKVS
jgi:hypothetical protein